MRDGLNAGLPSDRFQVDWWITSPRGEGAHVWPARAAGARVFYPGRRDDLEPNSGQPRRPDAPFRTWRTATDTLALIEIPTNFQAIKIQDMGLARAWRSQTRAMFTEAFGTGYWVTDFFHEPLDGRVRSFYALSRGEIRIGVSEN